MLDEDLVKKQKFSLQHYQLFIEHVDDAFQHLWVHKINMEVVIDNK
jgi:hypothetical protein